jgi:hypothetical protein
MGIAKVKRGRQAALFSCVEIKWGDLRDRGFWPFAGKSDIRPAARSAESRDFVGY